MKYAKPPLSLEAQADRLLNRGMVGDRDLMIARLRSVSYYRLSGYWYPFRSVGDDSFKPNTSFDEVWNRYVFDRRLRLLVMDAIERIEVAVRSQMAHHHSLHYGPFAYATDAGSLPKLKPAEYRDFLAHIEEETKRSHETFAKHFRTKYGDCHKYLPIWMASEVMAFGSVLTFYKGARRKEKKPVADIFNLPDAVFESWLLTLHMVRNICAHHGRLWNRELGVKPLIPLASDYPDWHNPVVVRNNRTFAVLTMCQWCLARIAPQSGWADRFRKLLAAFPNIPIHEMGFPVDWEQCPIWTPSGGDKSGTSPDKRAAGRLGDWSVKAIEAAVDRAIVRLTTNDAVLLANDVNERSISQQLAVYLQDEFTEWHVDCEYNRDRNEIKQLGRPGSNAKTDDVQLRMVVPDIIVHHRLTDENLLVIELKKKGVDADADVGKLEDFTKDGYKYFLGLLLIIAGDGSTEKRWFAEGRELLEESHGGEDEQ